MKDKCVYCGAEIPKKWIVCTKCLVRRGNTNYGRIVSMGVVDLAEFICENTAECSDCKGYSYCTMTDGHANGLIKWLKKGVEDGQG